MEPKMQQRNLGQIDSKLSESDLQRINELAPFGFTKGSRCPEQAMKAFNR